MTESDMLVAREHAVDSCQADDGASPAVDGLRVLHVIDRLAMGGTQNLLLRSLAELERRGVESHVCVLASEQTTDDGTRDLVSPTYLDFPGDYRNPLAVRGCVRQLCQLIDRLQPDIVHSYLWVSDYVSARAVGSSAIDHVCHIVDRRDWQASDRWVHRVRKHMTQRAFTRAGTRFVAVSQAAKDFACEHMAYSPENVAVAANGIDWKQFADVDSRSNRAELLILGTAGRVEHEKGHHYLLEAVRQLVQQDFPVELRITGEGPLKADLESFVDEHGLQDRVTFLGWVPSVTDFYREIDLFVVPSVNAEGLPTTILEAMATGCVVVASDVGGAGEAIRDGIDGCLVPSRDVESLVSVIKKLGTDPEALSRMGESARLRIQEYFTTKKMVDVICETYATCRKAASAS